MARTFPCEPLDLEVPLGTTWEETWQLTDDDGEPIDLTGYEFRMQVRSKDAANAVLLEIDSLAGGDATIEPLTGTVTFSVDAVTVSAIAADNRKRKTLFDAELYIPAAVGVAPYVIPVVAGVAVFLPRQTRPPVVAE